MARKSARLLGAERGMNAHQVYLALEHLGLLTQTRNSCWELTEEGKKYGEPSKHPYSLGYIWDDIVVDMIDDMLTNSDWRP